MTLDFAQQVQADTAAALAGLDAVLTEATKARLHVDALVKVEGHRSVWRILRFTATGAHLTNLRSFERVDLRNIPIERLTLAPGILA